MLRYTDPKSKVKHKKIVLIFLFMPCWGKPCQKYTSKSSKVSKCSLESLFASLISRDTEWNSIAMYLCQNLLISPSLWRLSLVTSNGFNGDRSAVCFPKTGDGCSPVSYSPPSHLHHVGKLVLYSSSCASLQVIHRVQKAEGIPKAQRTIYNQPHSENQ